MRGCKVLLVEDDDELRRLYRTILSLTGCQVTEAANGLDALRKIEADLPDAVVLDLNLPHLSGVGVLSDLAQQTHTRHIPVVVVTASSESLDHLRVAAVLRKPVSPDELIATIKRFVK